MHIVPALIEIAYSAFELLGFVAHGITKLVDPRKNESESLFQHAGGIVAAVLVILLVVYGLGCGLFWALSG